MNYIPECSVAIASIMMLIVSSQAQTIGGSESISRSSLGSNRIGGGMTSSQPSSGAGSVGWPPNPWPPSLGSAGVNARQNSSGVTSATNTDQLATQGSSSVTSVNADEVARSGNFGAATRIGNGSAPQSAQTGTNTEYPSISGTGPAELYNIPQPHVSVDLDGIRQALSVGPNATPNKRGF